MAAALATAALVATLAAPSCPLGGTYVDRGGNVMLLAATPDAAGFELAASAVYGTLPGGARSATGRAAADARSLWLFLGAPSGANQSATLVNDCAALWFGTGLGSDNQVWGRTSAAAVSPNVTTVHITNMAHLDLGYTDLARGVCDLYLSVLFPLNLVLIDVLKGTPTPFGLTTHSILIEEFLDGAAGCVHSDARPNASLIAAVEAAIRGGDIRWHAQSANYFPEAMDAASFLAMLDSVDALNARYGVRNGHTLFKSTDTPGLSRAIIPLLNARGRRAVHMGANGKCTMSKLPQAFTWAHPETGTSVLALSSNGYGGTFVVGAHALIIEYQGDNSPPPLPEQVKASFASAAAFFPGAVVKLSSLDDFAEAVLASPQNADLPVWAGEIGNSWLYGLPSDPSKVAEYRETLRVIQAALAGNLSTPPLDVADLDLLDYRRRILISTPEHNGGVSIGEFLPNERTPTGHWSNAAFASVFKNADFQFVESSYQEKRAFMEPLAPRSQPTPAWTAFLAAREAAIAAIVPAMPDLAGYVRAADPLQPLACAGSRLRVSFAADGSLARVLDVASGHDFVDSGIGRGPLRFSYRTYDEADFAAFDTNYTPGCGVPCINFAKVGMDSAAPASREWLPSLTGLFVKQGTAGGPACSAVALLALDNETVTKYGGMPQLWLQVDVDVRPTGAPSLGASIGWLNKTRSRMAESAWMSFAAPNVSVSASVGPAAAGDWRLGVLGSQVDPQSGALWGARWLYAVDSHGESYEFAGTPGGGAVRRYSVRSLDAPLASPGGDTTRLVGYAGADLPPADGSVSFNLENNVWGSTFCQWNAGDALFRFVLSMDASPA